MAATNHVDDVDAALLRPGRLDKVIHVLPPDDPDVRVAMLRSHLHDDLVDADLSLIGVATDGATGADLMGLVQTARRRARVARRPITVDDLVAAAIPASTVPDAVDWRCAVHEAGHAVVASMLGLEVDTLSLLRTGVTAGSMGFIRKDGGIHDRDYGERLVRLLLGGMAAEDVLLGSRSTAAGGPVASDLGRATSMLAANRHSHGLGDRLLYLGSPDEIMQRLHYDPRLAGEIEHDLQRLFTSTKAMVAEHAVEVRAVATRLRKDRVMSGETVRDVMRQARRGPPVGV